MPGSAQLLLRAVASVCSGEVTGRSPSSKSSQFWLGKGGRRTNPVPPRNAQPLLPRGSQQEQGLISEWGGRGQDSRGTSPARITILESPSRSFCSFLSLHPSASHQPPLVPIVKPLHCFLSFLGIQTLEGRGTRGLNFPDQHPSSLLFLNFILPAFP